MIFTKKLAIKLAKDYLTEDDLCQLLVESVERIRRNKEDDAPLFAELRKVDGFQDYLTATLVADKDRYFAAGTPMEQLMTKGAFNRTLYLRSKLRENKDVARLDSPRHA